jgi:AcrR family transcriptional regulator
MARPRTDIAPRIIKAARKAFARSGVDGTSLREIARSAGTSIGMVYYYYRTKDELFYAVVEEVYSGLLNDLEQALAPDRSVEDRIRALYLRIGATTPLELTTIRLVLREMLGSKVRRARLLSRFKRGHVAMVLSTLKAGVEQGTLNRSLHPAVLLLSTFGLGAVPQFIVKAIGAEFPIQGFPTGPELSETLAKVLFEGIGTRSEK